VRDGARGEDLGDEMLAYALHSRDPGKGYGMGNYVGYSNRELDRISDENLSIFDPKRRLETLQKALRLAGQDLPYLPLFVAENVYVVSDAIEWTPPVNEEVRVTDVTFKASGVAGGP
jgi:ABC-type transport system substrate-binding protein